MDREAFVKMMASIAVARQCEILDTVSLELYYHELSIYPDGDLDRAAGIVRGQPYRTFPTLGDFLAAIHHRLDSDTRSVWAGNPPPQPRAEILHAQHKRRQLQLEARQLLEEKPARRHRRSSVLAAKNVAIGRLRAQVQEQATVIVQLRAQLREKSRLERIDEQRRLLREQAELLRHSEQPDAVNE